MVVDFDGTAHELDVLDAVCSRHAPAETAAAEVALLAGEITLNECIRREFEPIRADHDEIVAERLSLGRLRQGFERFVTAARAAGHRVVIVSSGFHAIIGPVLEEVGLATWRCSQTTSGSAPGEPRSAFGDGESCESCGERCSVRRAQPERRRPRRRHW